MSLIERIRKLVTKCKKEKYFVWEKGTYFQFYDNFNSIEFQCRCNRVSCVEQKIAKNLVRKLQKLRDKTGPIKINSGYRCTAHQAKLRRSGIKTAKKTSQHELGRAADIMIMNTTTQEDLGNVSKFFKAIGVARNWLHVDLRDDKVRRWSY